MKELLAALFFLGLCFSGCRSDQHGKPHNEYLRWVGDIENNPNKDHKDYKVCNGDDSIFQYFNLGEGPSYLGEKEAIEKIFSTAYEPVPMKGQNGMIRIRFVVNCEGKAGRFRVLQAGYDYAEREFDQKITGQLLSVAKGIENWQILYLNGNAIDYYMYLIFKMENGEIIEILP